jgi:hypothetical protein
MTQTLLELGADPAASNYMGNTPIKLACCAGSLDVTTPEAQSPD